MSFVHHLTIGNFDHRLYRMGREPVALNPLDRDWIERRLAEANPQVARQFWFGNGECLWANWYGAGLKRCDEIRALAEEIAHHHGTGYLVVHNNNGEVLFPEEWAQVQRRYWQELNA